jgi:adhesin/invasin
VPSGTLKGRIVAAYVRADAALSIQSSSGNIGKGSSVTISGALNPARLGTVTIYQSVNGSGFAALTTATLSNGQYSLAVTPSSLGTYQFRASWPGDDLYNAADSSTTSVTVSAQPTLTATITATPTSIYSGGTSTIRVTLTSQATAVAGATVTFASDKGGTFSTVTDSGNGTYTSTYTAPDINAQTTITVTATASKTGYAGSSAQTQITAQLLVLNITIKGSDGSSIDGATVASTSQPSGQTALNKTTDANGLVSFTGVLKGSYTFKATKTGYDDKTWTVTVQAGQVTTETATLSKPSASPGIPGFPYESIVLGLIAGIIVVWLLQRKH